jgi:hypothetical protein
MNLCRFTDLRFPRGYSCGLALRPTARFFGEGLLTFLREESRHDRTPLILVPFSARRNCVATHLAGILVSTLLVLLC